MQHASCDVVTVSVLAAFETTTHTVPVYTPFANLKDRFDAMEIFQKAQTTSRWPDYLCVLSYFNPDLLNPVFAAQDSV
jgi:hypothetical protein